jgi:hypothetical protein
MLPVYSNGNKEQDIMTDRVVNQEIDHVTLITEGMIMGIITNNIEEEDNNSMTIEGVVVIDIKVVSSNSLTRHKTHITHTIRVIPISNIHNSIRGKVIKARLMVISSIRGKIIRCSRISITSTITGKGEMISNKYNNRGKGSIKIIIIREITIIIISRDTTITITIKEIVTIITNEIIVIYDFLFNLTISTDSNQFSR